MRFELDKREMDEKLKNQMEKLLESSKLAALAKKGSSDVENRASFFVLQEMQQNLADMSTCV